MEPSGVSRVPGFRVLALLFFCQKSAVTIMVLAFSSLFLSEYGPGGWPWYFVCFPALFIVTQLMMLPHARLKGRGFLSGALPGFALLAFAFAIFGEKQSGLLIFAALVGFRCFDLHSAQAFFDLSGQILLLRDAKRGLPVIMALGTIGSIMAGLFLKFLLAQTGFPMLFLFGAILFLGARFSLNLLPPQVVEISPGAASPAAPPPVSASGNGLPRTGNGDPETPAFPEIYRKYCLAVIVISMFGSLIVNLVEFQFNGNLPRFFPDAASMASFLGLVNAAIDLSVLLTQGLLGGWLFSRLPLGLLLGIRPVFTFLAASVAWFHPSLSTMVGAQFLTRTSTFVFMAPVWVLLFEPLPQEARGFYRRWLNIADSCTIISVGLGLLVWKHFGGGPVGGIFLIIAGIAIFTLTRNARVLSLYPAMIQATLEARSTEENLAGIEGLGFLSRVDRIRHLRTLFSDPRPDVRGKAIVQLGSNPEDWEEGLLMPLLESESDPANLNALIRLLSVHPAGRACLRSFLETPREPRVLADVLESLAPTLGHGEEKSLLALFPHPNHRVRGNALWAYLKYGWETSSLESAVAALAQMVRAEPNIERASAAVVIGRLGSAEFLPELFALARDPGEDVARCAFRSLGALRTTSALEFLAREAREGTGKAASMASEALEEATRRDPEVLWRMFGGMTEEERQQSGFLLHGSGLGIPLATLQKVFRLPSGPRRGNLLKILGEGEPVVARIVEKCLEVPREGGWGDPTPLLEHLRTADFREPPAGMALIRFFFDRDDPGLLEVFQKKLSFLVRAFVILEEIRKRIPEPANGKPLLEGHGEYESWNAKLLHLSAGIALLTDDPPSLLDAVRAVQGKDTFMASVAVELLERLLPHSIVSVFVPLLEWRRNPGVVRGLVPTLGMDGIGSSDLESLRSELSRLEVMK